MIKGTKTNKLLSWILSGAMLLTGLPAFPATASVETATMNEQNSLVPVVTLEETTEEFLGVESAAVANQSMLANPIEGSCEPLCGTEAPTSPVKLLTQAEINLIKDEVNVVTDPVAHGPASFEIPINSEVKFTNSQNVQVINSPDSIVAVDDGIVSVQNDGTHFLPFAGFFGCESFVYQNGVNDPIIHALKDKENQLAGVYEDILALEEANGLEGLAVRDAEEADILNKIDAIINNIDDYIRSQEVGDRYGAAIVTAWNSYADLIGRDVPPDPDDDSWLAEREKFLQAIEDIDEAVMEEIQDAGFVTQIITQIKRIDFVKTGAAALTKIRDWMKYFVEKKVEKITMYHQNVGDRTDEIFGGIKDICGEDMVCQQQEIDWWIGMGAANIFQTAMEITVRIVHSGYFKQAFYAAERMLREPSKRLIAMINSWFISNKARIDKDILETHGLLNCDGTDASDLSDSDVESQRAIDIVNHSIIIGSAFMNAVDDQVTRLRQGIFMTLDQLRTWGGQLLHQRADLINQRMVWVNVLSPEVIEERAVEQAIDILTSMLSLNASDLESIKGSIAENPEGAVHPYRVTLTLYGSEYLFHAGFLDNQGHMYVRMLASIEAAVIAMNELRRSGLYFPWMRFVNDGMTNDGKFKVKVRQVGNRIGETHRVWIWHNFRVDLNVRTAISNSVTMMNFDMEGIDRSNHVTIQFDPIEISDLGMDGNVYSYGSVMLGFQEALKFIQTNESLRIDESGNNPDPYRVENLRGSTGVAWDGTTYLSLDFDLLGNGRMRSMRITGTDYQPTAKELWSWEDNTTATAIIDLANRFGLTVEERNLITEEADGPAAIVLKLNGGIFGYNAQGQILLRYQRAVEIMNALRAQESIDLFDLRLMNSVNNGISFLIDIEHRSGHFSGVDLFIERHYEYQGLGGGLLALRSVRFRRLLGAVTFDFGTVNYLDIDAIRNSNVMYGWNGYSDMDLYALQAAASRITNHWWNTANDEIGGTPESPLYLEEYTDNNNVFDIHLSGNTTLYEFDMTKNATTYNIDNFTVGQHPDVSTAIFEAVVHLVLSLGLPAGGTDNDNISTASLTKIGPKKYAIVLQLYENQFHYIVDLNKNPGNAQRIVLDEADAAAVQAMVDLKNKGIGLRWMKVEDNGTTDQDRQNKIYRLKLRQIGNRIGDIHRVWIWHNYFVQLGVQTLTNSVTMMNFDMAGVPNTELQRSEHVTLQYNPAEASAVLLDNNLYAFPAVLLAFQEAFEEIERSEHENLRVVEDGNNPDPYRVVNLSGSTGLAWDGSTYIYLEFDILGNGRIRNFRVTGTDYNPKAVELWSHTDDVEGWAIIDLADRFGLAKEQRYLVTRNTEKPGMVISFNGGDFIYGEQFVNPNTRQVSIWPRYERAVEIINHLRDQDNLDLFDLRLMNSVNNGISFLIDIEHRSGHFSGVDLFIERHYEYQGLGGGLLALRSVRFRRLLGAVTFDFGTVNYLDIDAIRNSNVMYGWNGYSDMDLYALQAAASRITNHWWNTANDEIGGTPEDPLFLEKYSVNGDVYNIDLGGDMTLYQFDITKTATGYAMDNFTVGQHPEVTKAIWASVVSLVLGLELQPGGNDNDNIKVDSITKLQPRLYQIVLDLYGNRFNYTVNTANDPVIATLERRHAAAIEAMKDLRKKGVNFRWMKFENEGRDGEIFKVRLRQIGNRIGGTHSVWIWHHYEVNMDYVDLGWPHLDPTSVSWASFTNIVSDNINLQDEIIVRFDETKIDRIHEGSGGNIYPHVFTALQRALEAIDTGECTETSGNIDNCDLGIGLVAGSDYQLMDHESGSFYNYIGDYIADDTFDLVGAGKMRSFYVHGYDSQVVADQLWSYADSDAGWNIRHLTNRLYRTEDYPFPRRERNHIELIEETTVQDQVRYTFKFHTNEFNVSYFVYSGRALTEAGKAVIKAIKDLQAEGVSLEKIRAKSAAEVTAESRYMVELEEDAGIWFGFQIVHGRFYDVFKDWTQTYQIINIPTLTFLRPLTMLDEDGNPIPVTFDLENFNYRDLEMRALATAVNKTVLHWFETSDEEDGGFFESNLTLVGYRMIESTGEYEVTLAGDSMLYKVTIQPTNTFWIISNFEVVMQPGAAEAVDMAIQDLASPNRLKLATQSQMYNDIQQVSVERLNSFEYKVVLELYGNQYVYTAVNPVNQTLTLKQAHAAAIVAMNDLRQKGISFRWMKFENEGRTEDGKFKVRLRQIGNRIGDTHSVWIWHHYEVNMQPWVMSAAVSWASFTNIVSPNIARTDEIIVRFNEQEIDRNDGPWVGRIYAYVFLAIQDALQAIDTGTCNENSGNVDDCDLGVGLLAGIDFQILNHEGNSLFSINGEFIANQKFDFVGQGMIRSFYVHGYDHTIVADEIWSHADNNEGWNIMDLEKRFRLEKEDRTLITRNPDGPNITLTFNGSDFTYQGRTLKPEYITAVNQIMALVDSGIKLERLRLESAFIQNNMHFVNIEQAVGSFFGFEMKLIRHYEAYAGWNPVLRSATFVRPLGAVTVNFGYFNTHFSDWSNLSLLQQAVNDLTLFWWNTPDTDMGGAYEAVLNLEYFQLNAFTQQYRIRLESPVYVYTILARKAAPFNIIDDISVAYQQGIADAINQVKEKMRTSLHLTDAEFNTLQVHHITAIPDGTISMTVRFGMLDMKFHAQGFQIWNGTYWLINFEGLDIHLFSATETPATVTVNLFEYPIDTTDVLAIQKAVLHLVQKDIVVPGTDETFNLRLYDGWNDYNWQGDWVGFHRFELRNPTSIFGFDISQYNKVYQIQNYFELENTAANRLKSDLASRLNLTFEQRSEIEVASESAADIVLKLYANTFEYHKPADSAFQLSFAKQAAILAINDFRSRYPQAYFPWIKVRSVTPGYFPDTFNVELRNIHNLPSLTGEDVTEAVWMIDHYNVNLSTNNAVAQAITFIVQDPRSQLNRWIKVMLGMSGSLSNKVLKARFAIRKAILYLMGTNNPATGSPYLPITENEIGLYGYSGWEGSNMSGDYVGDHTFTFYYNDLGNYYSDNFHITHYDTNYTVDHAYHYGTMLSGQVSTSTQSSVQKYFQSGSMSNTHMSRLLSRSLSTAYPASTTTTTSTQLSSASFAAMADTGAAETTEVSSLTETSPTGYFWQDTRQLTYQTTRYSLVEAYRLRYAATYFELMEIIRRLNTFSGM